MPHQRVVKQQQQMTLMKISFSFLALLFFCALHSLFDYLLENHKYAHTLNLPVTDFPMRSNAVEREPQLIKDVQQLYDWQYNNPAQNKGQWVTHDGPPYANGDLHLGHALNKMLKDFVNRYKVMQGYKVRYALLFLCFRHSLTVIQLCSWLGLPWASN